MRGHFVLLVLIVFLLSSCSDKTTPVVTDVSGGAVVEPPKEEVEEVEEDPAETEESGAEEETAGDAESAVEEESDEEVEEETGSEEVQEGVYTITIQDLKLSNKELTVKKGETVIWEHNDAYETDGQTKHMVAAHTNEFRSGIMLKGDKFEHTFEDTGTFTYIDVFYKDKGDLRGTIIVE